MARKQTHECRNCGAPLGIPEDHERFFTCKYCGSVLEDVTPPEQKAQGQIQINLASIPIDSDTLKSYAKPVKRAGIVIMLAVFGVIGVSIAAVVAAVAGSDGLLDTVTGKRQVYNHASSATIASDDDTGPDVVNVARTSDELQLQYLDFDASPPTRWSVAADLPESSEVFTQFVAAPELVVVSAGDLLRAHNRGSGAVAWTATLTDKVEPNICTDCFRLVGDRVVTLTADGVLAAHSLTSGEQIWSRTLEEVPRQIVMFGENPAVLDTVADVTTLHVFSAAGGEDTAQVPLSCIDPTFGDVRDVGIYDHLFQGPGGSVVYIGNPAFSGCAQYWTPASTSTPAWQVAYEYPDPTGADPAHVQVSASTVLVAAGTSIDLLDLATGAVRRVTDLSDTTLYPVGPVENGGVAVVAAESTRGSASWSLQGIDLNTGGVKWTFGVEASELLLEDSFSFAVDDVWTATLGGPGVVVAQYRPDDVALVTQTIPLDSGTASQPAIIDVDRSGFSDTLTVLDWFGTDLHLSMNGTYLVADVAGGKLRSQVG